MPETQTSLSGMSWSKYFPGEPVSIQVTHSESCAPLLCMAGGGLDTRAQSAPALWELGGLPRQGGVFGAHAVHRNC